MKNKVKYFLTLLIVFVLLFFVCQDNFYQKDLNHQDWKKWKKHYKSKIKTKEDAYIAINSMIASLDDDYSMFMSKEQFAQFNNAMNSKFYGIGIKISAQSGIIKVSQVMKNSPAQKEGVQKGDIILKMNNYNTQKTDVSQLAQLIKQDSVKNVSLEILRNNKKILKNLKKEEIEIESLQYKKLENNTGYIKISNFSSRSYEKKGRISIPWKSWSRLGSHFF